MSYGVTRNCNDVTGIRNGSYTLQLQNHCLSYLKDISWDRFRKWLERRSSKHHAYNTYLYAKRYHELVFSDELVNMETSRKKADILKALSNLLRYIDTERETDLRPLFLQWMKRKEIKWNQTSRIDTYVIARRFRVEEVIRQLQSLPVKLRIFSIFCLATGLRTEEAIKALEAHDDLCDGTVMDLFWDRRTKKANAVFCHPIVHQLVGGRRIKVSKRVYAVWNKFCSFKIGILRKINFTINASRVDPLLAEFMQGRKGNVSERHYYLPLMHDHYQKYAQAWSPILEPIGSGLTV